MAAAAVPPKEPTVRQGHAHENLGTLRKVNMLGERNNDFRSTQFIEDRVVRALKKVGKGLAVLAVANGPH